MKKIIRLMAPGTADDLSCRDGELEEGAFIFEEAGESGDSPAPGTDQALSPGLGEPVFHMPAGALWVAMHRPVPGAAPRPVFIDPLMLGLSPGEAAEEPKCVAVGEWLVLLHRGRLIFGLFGAGDYEWLGPCPGTPQTEWSAVPRAIPPYSTVDGDMPRISVSVPAGSDVNAAIAAARSAFTDAVKEAGMHLGRVSAFACWRLRDGSLWQLSQPQTVGPEGEMTLRTVSSDYHDGVTHLTLEASQAPYEAVAAPAAPPELWNDVIVGTEQFVCSEGETPPDVPGAITGAEDIFSIGGCLFAATADGGGTAIACSVQGLPFVDSGREPARLPSPLLYLTGSLRTAPLYAFCADGIHAIGLKEGGYADVQLISRHVAAGCACFAPLPDGTAFIAAQGVMKLSGTTVRPMAGADMLTHALPPEGVGPACTLLYICGADKTAVCGPGSFDGHHYAWPEVWLRKGTAIGPAVTIPASAGAGLKARGASIRIVTRPLKLTDAFAVKKLQEVHALWPGGGREPLRVWGAMHPGGPWRPLGTAPGGRMLMRGSGWRLFRIETYAIPTESGYAIPQILIKFAV